MTSIAPSLANLDLVAANLHLQSLSAVERVRWAMDQGAGMPVLTSSFGAQSAVALHLLTQQVPDIPVILVDTGYLFPETYRFADELTQRLSLNLRIYRPQLSTAWMEARYGNLWEQGCEGIERYNRLRKVEPLNRALTELTAGTWFTGLRRSQSESRQAIGFVEQPAGRLKVNPLADWTDRQVWAYLNSHKLPYHPLWEEGYVSIGDFHTTRRWEPGMREEDTRFFGLKRECGIHEASVLAAS